MCHELSLIRAITKLACVALAAAPAVGAADARTTPQPDITVVPWGTSLAVPAGATRRNDPVDPRALAIATQLGSTLEKLRWSRGPVSGAGRGRPQSAGPPVNNNPVASGVQKSQAAVPTAKAVPGTQVNVSTAPAFGIRTRPGGTIRALSAPAGDVLHAKVAGGDQATVNAFLLKQRSLLGLANPQQELRLHRQQPDSLGHRHLRYRQTYRGLPVDGAELIAQLDAAGNLITLNGAYAATPVKLVTRPVVNVQDATATARALYDPTGRGLRQEPELVVYLKDRVTPRLAWKLQMAATVSEAWLVMVDAHGGAVLSAVNQVLTAGAVGSGQDLFGQTHTLNLWEEGGSYYMVNTSKPMFDPTSNPPAPPDTRGAIIVQDFANTDNGPANAVTSNTPDGPWLADGVSAAVNLSLTFDYFLQRHNRNSLNGAGGSILAMTRVGQNLDNAFFNESTQSIFFGDADEWAGTIDFVAHELTHGVVNNSAQLRYQNESGALNESFADIFGELTEAFATGQTDWQLGSRLNQPLRNMANPGALTFAPGRPYPSRMSEFVQPTDPVLDSFPNRDAGGVHFNSSIPNHAFYLLAVGLPDAIGMQDAAQIFYRALTTKLTALSQFIDARVACVQSAAELFGANSPQAQRTAEAFDAVEIFDTSANPPPEPFPEIDGPDATLFVYWDSNVGAYYLGRIDLLLGDTLPGIQLTANPVAPIRPSVSGDGTLAVFVNAQRDLCLINTDSPGQEACLGSPGTIASVAMAPDGETFGFVFLDAQGNPGNTISVIDVVGGKSQTFSLLAPAPDSNTSIAVLSADAMDFTADGRFLVYDAFNAIEFAGGSMLGLWSIYAIDLLTDATLIVVPPSPGLNIAFPSVAQTSDSHLAFDVLNTSSGQNLVVAANVYTQAFITVGVTQGFSIPVYRGDDSSIVYSFPDSVPTLLSLVFQPLAADRITPVGGPLLWLSDAGYGAIYRRGDFAGPDSTDLDVSISASSQSIAPGGSVSYSVTVLNNGPDQATSINLANTVGVNASITGSGGDGNCTVAGSQLNCSLSSLSPGASANVLFDVTAVSVGEIVVGATAFSNQTDPDPTNNTAFVTVLVQADDSDADGVPDQTDNCIDVANSDQRDTDGDNIGNLCDPDVAAPNDCVVNFLDLNVYRANFFGTNPDTDNTGDGVTNFLDLNIVRDHFFGPPGPSAAGCN